MKIFLTQKRRVIQPNSVHGLHSITILPAVALTVLLFIFGLSLANRVEAAAGSYTINWAAADPAPNSGPYQPTYRKLRPVELPCPTPTGGVGRAADPLKDAIFGVYCAFVESADSATIDPGNNAKVDSYSTALVGSDLQGKIQVSGLNDGDTAFIEIWLVL